MSQTITGQRRMWQRRVLALCWVAYALSYLCRTNLSIALPSMTQELGWSAAKAGMIGSAFFISYGAGHLLNGLLGDKLPIKRFMALGLLGTSLCNLLIGVFPYYGVIFVVWLINGLFLSTLWGPIVRAVAVWYAPGERNLPAVIISISSLAGYLLSWAGLGILLTFTGWRGAFFLPGVVTLLFTLWFLLRMNDSPKKVGLEDFSREEAGEVSKVAPGEPLTLWQLIRRERLLFFCVAAVAQGVIKDGITLWEPTILTSLHDAPAGLVSAASALVPVFSMLGVLLSGRLMNRYYGREKKPGILLFLGTGGLCLLFFLLLGRSLWLDVLFFGAISALLCGINTLLLTYIPLRLSIYGRSSGVAGMFNFCAYLGAGLSGILSGVLADISGWGSSILLWLILCIIGTLAVVGGFPKKTQ